MPLNQSNKIQMIAPPPVPKRTFQGKIIQPKIIKSPEQSISPDLKDSNYESQTDLSSTLYDEEDDVGVFEKDEPRTNFSYKLPNSFRSRFSSEETQSSMDSDCQQFDAFDSPVRKYPKNPESRRLPTVPARKFISTPPKIPPPLPLRYQTSLDSGKLLQNGYLVNSFQNPSTKKIDSTIQEMQNRTNSQSGYKKKGIKPPPLTQIHHTKVNQRQDSNISSDSFSFTSSPGYNTKSMEAPLLQYVSKINKSVIHHQDSSDSFGMMVRNNLPKNNMRQDSTISSDSFSQTSSPGYNSKNMEAPLILAHSVKLLNSKFRICFLIELKF